MAKKNKVGDLKVKQQFRDIISSTEHFYKRNKGNNELKEIAQKQNKTISNKEETRSWRIGLILKSAIWCPEGWDIPRAYNLKKKKMLQGKMNQTNKYYLPKR